MDYCKSWFRSEEDVSISLDLKKPEIVLFLSIERGNLRKFGSLVVGQYKTTIGLPSIPGVPVCNTGRLVHA